MELKPGLSDILIQSATEISSERYSPSLAIRRQVTASLPQQRIEKNWLMFSYKEASPPGYSSAYDEKCYFIYQIYPLHAVYPCDEIDNIITANETKSFLNAIDNSVIVSESKSWISAALLSLKEVKLTAPFTSKDINFRKFSEPVVHGNSNPILVQLLDDVEPLYLSCFHIVHPETLLYIHFLYTFRAKPPFQIHSISKPLELIAAKEPSILSFSFVTSITSVNETKFFITYGSGDIESRVLMLTLKSLRNLFLG
jgi:hypothetical protein